MSFRQGQKVVCVVEASFWEPTGISTAFATGKWLPTPEKRAVYTVAGSCVAAGRVFLALAEIPDPPGFRGLAFAAAAFRPAVEPSIAVFEAILAKVNGGAPAPARRAETV